MIKELVRRLLYRHRASSELYVKHLRSIGATVGEDVTIYVPTRTIIDESYPWLLKIGNHVRITERVIILNHDYSWSVLKREKGGPIYGAAGKVHIGDNVFIGMNAIITRGVTIGNNCIIGAGSIVTKDCLDNGVYAGNPARRIAEVDDYLEKRKNAQLQEAKELAAAYYERFGKYPPVEVFHEFFMLFETEVSAQTKPWCREKMNLCCNFEETVEFMRNNPPMYPSYEAFLTDCFKEIQ